MSNVEPHVTRAAGFSFEWKVTLGNLLTIIGLAIPVFVWSMNVQATLAVHQAQFERIDGRLSAIEERAREDRQAVKDSLLEIRSMLQEIRQDLKNDRARQ